MTARTAVSNQLAPALRTYCARNDDGGSRKAIDRVGAVSMQNRACSTKKKRSGHVFAPATMR